MKVSNIFTKYEVLMIRIRPIGLFIVSRVSSTNYGLLESALLLADEYNLEHSGKTVRSAVKNCLVALSYHLCFNVFYTDDRSRMIFFKL